MNSNSTHKGNSVLINGITIVRSIVQAFISHSAAGISGRILPGISFIIHPFLQRKNVVAHTIPVYGSVSGNRSITLATIMLKHNNNFKNINVNNNPTQF